MAISSGEENTSYITLLDYITWVGYNINDPALNTTFFAEGGSYTIHIINGHAYVTECEGLLQMMAVLELYTINYFNKTTDHRDDVRTYKFKGVGYPEIPIFYL